MSEVSTFIKFSQYLLGNPAVRCFLKFSCQHCRKCSHIRIEQVLDRYLNRNIPEICITCELTSIAGRFLLDMGSFVFKAGKPELKALISDVHARRGLISVLQGLAEFGVRKPQTTGAPFLVVWNYTYACNLRCKHCYSSAGKPSPKELTTEEALRVVDQLADLYVVALSFSGGEPLMRKDFFEVAKYATDKGLYVSLATNGTLINDDVAHELKNACVEYIDVSLDGADPKTHDTFRGVPGSFERAIEGIKACVNAGFYTCVAMTVTKRNLNEVPEVVELAKELRVKRFLAFNFIPTGRGKTVVDIDLTPLERENLLESLYRELVKSVAGKGGIEAFSTAPQFARTAMESSQIEEAILPAAHYGSLFGSAKLLADFIGGCGAGRIYCSISPEGYVDPCVFLPIRVGNLKRESFKDIWRKSKVLNELRDKNLLRGQCARCKYRFVCGGCRARAYSYFGDYLASDPGCPLVSINAKGHLGLPPQKGLKGDD